MATVTDNLEVLTWPTIQLGEAIEFLARRHGLISEFTELPAPPQFIQEAMTDTHESRQHATTQWIEAVASRLELDAIDIEIPYPEVEHLLAGTAPALFRLPSSTEVEPDRWLVVLAGNRQTLTLVTPNLSVRRVQLSSVRDLLCQPLEAPLVGYIDQFLNEAGVPEVRRTQAKAALLREQLNEARIEGGWLLRTSPSANIWRQANQAQLSQHLFAIVGVRILTQIIPLLSWWLIGQGILAGRFERGWLVAWALLLFTVIPFQLWSAWSSNLLSIGAGGILKQRLLYGILRLQPEEIRHQGAGQFLGRVMEVEAFETLALGGGFTAAMSVIELAIALWVLAQGPGGWPHSLLLLGWVLLAAILGWQYFRRGKAWMEHHLNMTDDLVERMVGHRTRLAQERREYWHDREDEILDQYLKRSIQVDSIGLRLNAIVVQGWMILGLIGLAYPFITGTASRATLALGLGGVMLGSQTLGGIISGITSVLGLMFSWQQLGPLYHAAARPAEGDALTSLFMGEPTSADSQVNTPIVMARDITFRYQDRGQPILQNCSLRIQAGERLLLEGPSGGGKSTLASILIGLRTPESGLLMLHGLDRASLGSEAWRQRVVAAPQFHENHVLTETFAFNLLMGREWPPQPEDLAEAQEICHELGLGQLLETMPAGMQQMVGEGGWRLSHGERSRLYIARALLQKADLIVLDESFASLDPINMHRALECVLRRAPTLLVIAHP